MRKTFFIILIAIIIFSLSSCEQDPRQDKSLIGAVVLIPDESETTWIGVRYQDANYYEVDSLHFSLDNTAEDTLDKEYTLIGWNGAKWYYPAYYYSYTVDSPIFIYCTLGKQVFLHEKYDYMQDIFVINGTNDEIMLSDVYEDFSSPFEEFQKISFSVTLHSKMYPHLELKFDVKNKSNSWFIENNLRTWKASDSFIDLLIKNGFI